MGMVNNLFEKNIIHVKNFTKYKSKSQIFLGILSVSQILKSTLGPMGKSKIIISLNETSYITNSGFAIVKNLNVINPCAQLLINICIIHNQQFGDGTSFLNILIGEILKECDYLINNIFTKHQIICALRHCCKFTLSTLNNYS